MGPSSRAFISSTASSGRPDPVALPPTSTTRDGRDRRSRGQNAATPYYRSHALRQVGRTLAGQAGTNGSDRSINDVEYVVSAALGGSGVTWNNTTWSKAMWWPLP